MNKEDLIAAVLAGFATTCISVVAFQHAATPTNEPQRPTAPGTISLSSLESSATQEVSATSDIVVEDQDVDSEVHQAEKGSSVSEFPDANEEAKSHANTAHAENVAKPVKRADDDNGLQIHERSKTSSEMVSQDHADQLAPQTDISKPGNANFNQSEGSWLPAIEIVDLPHRQLIERGDLVLIAQVNGRVFALSLHEEEPPVVESFRPSSHWSDVGLSVDAETQRRVAVSIANKTGNDFNMKDGGLASKDEPAIPIQCNYLLSQRLVGIIREAQIKAASQDGYKIEQIHQTEGYLELQNPSLKYVVARLSLRLPDALENKSKDDSRR